MLKKFLLPLPFLIVISLSLLIAFSLTPTPTSAAGLAQMAQCSGTDCGTCEIIRLANGLIMWLIGFVFILFALLLMRAGIKLVTSGGNPGALQSAKDSFINALIGLIIILAAWLIVDTIMRALIGDERSGALVWSEIECTAQVSPIDAVQEDILLQRLERYEDGTPINEEGIGGGDPTIPTDPAPPPAGNLVTYAGAQFDASIVDRVRYIAETFNLRVSGGYRTPERNRQVGGVANSRHMTGRAADFVGTQANMQAGLNWARANGAVEHLIHNAGSGTHLHVAW
ncbi:MAG: D-Ala-D-Ala carboxypeptidase family metallohydrolase [Candidatus Paceibacteria bacterium]